MQSPRSKKVPEESARLEAKHPDREVIVFFQDECRFGQQGTLTRVWAKRGSRPTAVRQTEYEYLWVIGAASPQTGQAEAILSSVLNTAIINQFLQFSRTGPERSRRPDLGRSWLPPRPRPRGPREHHADSAAAVLDVIEKLWHDLRSHCWSNRAYRDYDELFDVAEQSWCRYCLDTDLIKPVCAKSYIPTRC